MADIAPCRIAGFDDKFPGIVLTPRRAHAGVL
jgi:hypothetical protein